MADPEKMKPANNEEGSCNCFMINEKNANRLIHEKSPYLLQHAYNPVDWYPWGEEAFAKAARENKPVFVSIGYSTCHWCHVMEMESFEDKEMAKILNERFISIKVDREERPDIDSIYMNVCQMMTGHGGWPLSVFLTPEQKPFYAGTYFPKVPRYGMPSFKEVITQLSNQYADKRDQIENIAEDAKNALQQMARRQGDKLPGRDVLHNTYKQLSKSFDAKYGGFSEAPKFPIPHYLMFLLKYYKWTDADLALKMAEKTLNAMADGGIYDHIGFGFARYSTDEKWLVPHFEKMLYDNALLLYVYTEAYQVTKREQYQKIAEQIIAFIDREMTDRDGGFYSAIDADSEGVEGKYYVWTKEEVLEVLGKEDGELFCRVFDITEEGNFEGNNIPNLIDTEKLTAFSEAKLSEAEGDARLNECRKLLLQKRTERIYPHLDDKILTSWNAFMIAALAKAGKIFENQSYVEKAERALSFIEEKLMDGGNLYARYRDGEAKYPAYLDDWAFLLWAYIELYEASYSYHYLQKAVDAAKTMRELFWDEEDDGFFFTGTEGEELLVREKQIYDGAIPSGNSVAAYCLQRLGHLTGETKWFELTEQLWKVFKKEVDSYGAGYTFFLQSLLLKEFPVREVIVLGSKREDFLRRLQTEYTPELAIVSALDEKDLARIIKRGYKELDPNLTIYICENFTCNQPITDSEKALQELKIKNSK